ncbi:hypothetical protein SCG7086_AE_00100 [Chlamydiales bacterium SCGC AG-110-P3]|nr:hypothetical protein SCG7086_AE_00100 [Chlamydiales bacterium SCGC AG-110-P3]
MERLGGDSLEEKQRKQTNNLALTAKIRNECQLSSNLVGHPAPGEIQRLQLNKLREMRTDPVCNSITFN